MDSSAVCARCAMPITATSQPQCYILPICHIMHAAPFLPNLPFPIAGSGPHKNTSFLAPIPILTESWWLLMNRQTDRQTDRMNSEHRTQSIQTGHYAIFAMWSKRTKHTKIDDKHSIVSTLQEARLGAGSSRAAAQRQKRSRVDQLAILRVGNEFRRPTSCAGIY